MRQTTIGILIIIFSPIFNLVSERFMTNAPELFWRILSLALVVLGVGIVALSNPIFSKLKKPQDSPVISTLIVAISVAIIASAVWWFLIIPPNAVTSKNAINEPVIEPEIKSLRELFLQDCKQTNILGTYTLMTKKGKNIAYEIEYNICGDFKTKSLYISFFLPKSEHTIAAGRSLPRVYSELLSGALTTLLPNIVHRFPGERAEKWSELKPTGRIYIYHETRLLQERIDELYTEYKKESLSPQFRGRDYLILKNSPLYDSDVKR